MHLLHEVIPQTRSVIEPNAYRHETFFSQGRKHTGLEKRRLAQSGDAEEHREHASCDPALQVLILGVTALEEEGRVLGERIETRPGILIVQVDDAALSRDGRRGFG
jgi:hypothetical protein